MTDKKKYVIDFDAYKVSQDYYSPICTLFLEHPDCQFIECNLNTESTPVGALDRGYLSTAILMLATAISSYMSHTEIDDEFAQFLQNEVDILDLGISKITLSSKIEGEYILFGIGTFIGSDTKVLKNEYLINFKHGIK